MSHITTSAICMTSYHGTAEDMPGNAALHDPVCDTDSSGQYLHVSCHQSNITSARTIGSQANCQIYCFPDNGGNVNIFSGPSTIDIRHMKPRPGSCPIWISRHIRIHFDCRTASRFCNVLADIASARKGCKLTRIHNDILIQPPYRKRIGRKHGFHIHSNSIQLHHAAHVYQIDRRSTSQSVSIACHGASGRSAYTRNRQWCAAQHLDVLYRRYTTVEFQSQVVIITVKMIIAIPINSKKAIRRIFRFNSPSPDLSPHARSRNMSSHLQVVRPCRSGSRDRLSSRNRDGSIACRHRAVVVVVDDIVVDCDSLTLGRKRTARPRRGRVPVAVLRSRGSKDRNSQQQPEQK